jgi:hypothetical protein
VISMPSKSVVFEFLSKCATWTSESFRFPITPSTLPIYVSLESTITEPRAGHAPE